MKKGYAFSLLSGLLVLFCQVASAQMVGDNVFLQGRFVEIGVAPNGGYGSTFPAPTGYHPYLSTTTFTFYDPGAATSTTSGSFLGFVADYGSDGWTVGSPPFFGDYYLPGTPQEGWAIQVGGLLSNAYIPTYLSSGTTGFTGTGSLAGTNVSYSSVGGISKGVWRGTDGALAIRQTTILDTNKLYFTVNVVLTNTGTTPLSNIYYIRTVDPDNEETRTSDFTTINNIVYQLPNPGNKVLVSATGTSYSAYLGLGTKDCRAKCMIFDVGLAPSYSLDAMFNETTPYRYLLGTTYTSDVGIALEFNIGTLAAGDSTSLTYAYILNAAQIDSALNSTKPAFHVNATLFDSTDSINLCTYVPDSIIVNIANGDFYQWTWLPDSFLAHPGGSSNIIHSDSITSNITYTITGTSTGGACDSIKFYLRLQHGIFPGPTVTPVSYCQNDVAIPLTPAGAAYTWWPSATGGVGSTTPPTPSTTTPGVTLYYVSETMGLCQSLRSADTVTVKPLPAPPVLSGFSPYCQGQPFIPFTAAGTGILWYPTATGGGGSATAPTINTNFPGTYTYWASQTVNGCEGPRATVTATVLDSIVPGFSYDIHYGCKADTLVFNNYSRNAFRYVWDFGDGYTDTLVNPTHTYLLQDTFSIKLIGINNQCSDSISKTVDLRHPIHAAFATTPAPAIVCQHQPVAFNDSSVGTGLSYYWRFGNGATSTSMNTGYTYNNSGVYTAQLIVTDFVPCHDTATAIIQVDSITAIGLSVTDSVICKGTYATFNASYTSIGNTGISWTFGNGDSILDVNPVYHNYDVVGTYTVTATPHYRVCRDTSISHTITIFPTPNLYLGPDTSICPGSESLILGDVQNSSSAAWHWNTGAATPSIVVVEPGYYSATVTIHGCRASDTVYVQKNCYLQIPNVFSPNGDGLNDYFNPRELLAHGMTSFKMQIFNRWGQLIFETANLEGSGWDGKFNNVSQPQGVYVYVIDATFKDGQKEHHQGNVTLVK